MPDDPSQPASASVPALAHCAAAPDARNGMATAALVVGILAVVAGPFGPVFGVVAMALGFVAFGRARNLPAICARRGLAAAGVILGAAGTLLWGGVFVADALWTRDIFRRGVCAANLSRLGQGLNVYASDNLGTFPIVMYHEPADDAEDQTLASFIGQMGASYKTPLGTLSPGEIPKNLHMYAEPDTPGLPTKQNSIHPSRSLFLLVIDGTLTPKSFICPSAGDTEDDLRDSSPSSGSAPSQASGLRFDFKGYPYLSYGYQLPFGRMGKPSRNLAPQMPIVADKGPFLEAGTPRADGTVPDQPRITPGTALTIDGAPTAAEIRLLTDKQWQPFNSRNHGQDGQNVLRVDGSVHYSKTPIVGIEQDNIYTVQGPGRATLDVLLGRVPVDRLGPLTATDSVIVP